MSHFILTVGDKFEHNMPDESMSIMLNGGTPLLAFNFSVSKKNITDFLEGSISFGLFADRNIIFFLFKIDGFMDWSDLAFTIHLAGDERLDYTNSYLPIHLLLVESGTSIIKAMRVITVSPTFRLILSDCIQKQINEPFSNVDYYKNIGLIYEEYPEVIPMLKDAVIIEQGGLNFPK